MSELLESRSERIQRILDADGFIDTVCRNLAEGQFVQDVAADLDMSFGELSNWLNSTQERRARFKAAQSVRVEFMIESVQRELKAIAHLDIRKIFNPDGTVKPPNEWPDECAKAINGMEISEIFSDKALIGQLKKVKIADKLKALELIGKNTAMFVERHEITASKTLEDLLADTWKK